MHPIHDPHIDADHDRIIQDLERLTEHLRASETPEPSMLQGLRDYLQEHCSREEACMAADGYPERAAHQVAHAALRSVWEGGNVSQDLSLLRRSLLAHIVTWDEAYGVWRGAQSGLPEVRD